MGNCNAVLTLVTTATAAPVTVKLGGAGIAPILTVTPGALAFGAQPLGVVAEPKALVLHNGGTAPLDIRSVTISGANAADFTLVSDGGTGATLNPGDDARLTIRFTPTATGSRAAVLTITDPADSIAQTVALSGTGTEASVSISPASLDSARRRWGRRQLAGDRAAETGDAPLSIGSVTLAGDNPADFTITGDGWSGQHLQPGQVATLNLRFTPTAAGDRHAVLTVADDASGSPQTVTLAGTGTAPVASLDVEQPELPRSGRRHHQREGNGDADQHRHRAAGPRLRGHHRRQRERLRGRPRSGQHDARARPERADPPALPAHRRRPARRRPGHYGQRRRQPARGAALRNGTAPSVTFGISRLNSPSTIAFGNQALGASSATQTLTLTNSGTASLTITSISLTGANAGDYQIVADSGPASLAPGASRTLTVRFTPLALGMLRAWQSEDNAGGGTQTVGLTGAGVLPVVGTKGLILPIAPS